MRRLDRAMRIAVIVNASQLLQMLRIEALHADRQSIDPGRPIGTKAIALDCPGICFERDLGFLIERHSRSNRGEQRIDTRA